MRISDSQLVCMNIRGAGGGLYGQTQTDIIVSHKLAIISYNIYRTIYILADVLMFIHFSVDKLI
jgi:hypothetical protein